MSRGRSRSMRCSCAITPSSITRTRSARSTASSTSCVTSRTAQPRRCHNSPTRRCALMRVSASSAPNGSSSSSRSGSRTNARASEARWASPPESVLGQASLRWSRPTSFSARSATARPGLPGRPSKTLRHTFFHGISRGDWKATALRRGTRTVPSMSRSRPARMRSRVDLPQPLRPSRATNSPGRTSSWSRSMTARPSKERVSPATCTACVPAAVRSACVASGLTGR